MQLFVILLVCSSFTFPRRHKAKKTSFVSRNQSGEDFLSFNIPISKSDIFASEYIFNLNKKQKQKKQEDKKKAKETKEEKRIYLCLLICSSKFVIIETRTYDTAHRENVMSSLIIQSI